MEGGGNEGGKTGGGSFKIPLLWPKKLKPNWLAIQSAINSITPLEGLGTSVDRTPNGTQIHVGAPASSEHKIGEGGGGGGQTGTPIDLYGAYNGAPAIFHLSQTSPPSAPPP